MLFSLNVRSESVKIYILLVDGLRRYDRYDCSEYMENYFLVQNNVKIEIAANSELDLLLLLLSCRKIVCLLYKTCKDKISKIHR